MQNAHERFGTLEFTKRVKDTTTRVQVYIDRLIVEPVKDGRGQARAHLISIFGSDAEVGALWAGVIEGAVFQAQAPGAAGFLTSLGPEPQCFRGSISLPGRKHPVRHLVALSAEMLKTKPGADREARRTILCGDDPVFVLYRVARRFGLPVVPEWAAWFMGELERHKAALPLEGLGCSPILIKGTKQTFLGWISKALKQGSIRLPKKNGAVLWSLPPSFLDRPLLRIGEGSVVAARCLEEKSCQKEGYVDHSECLEQQSVQQRRV